MYGLDTEETTADPALINRCSSLVQLPAAEKFRTCFGVSAGRRDLAACSVTHISVLAALDAARRTESTTAALSHVPGHM